MKGAKGMPPINLLIKPASGNCNLRCKYCFYTDVMENRTTQDYGVMTEDTLETIVKKAIQQSEGTCTIAFQGGEPTLVGLDFYKTLIKYQNKYKKYNLTINNAIQTNGIIIDEEWAKFFGENKFLVGLSLDGYEYIHDNLRIDSKKAGTFNRVIKTAKLFDKYNVEYNILTVVTADVAKNINKIYKFFKANNFRYMQFIPCLDPLYEERGRYDHSLTPELYGEFLKTLFDVWYKDVKKGEFVYVRYFENLLQMMLGQYPEACGMLGRCTNQYVIEADGSVYPCDFYVLDEYRIGNLITDSFGEIEQKREEIGFIEPSLYKDTECKKCKWHNLCYGGCRRDREPIQNNKASRNYFCSAYKEFFEYTFSRLQEVARMIVSRSQ